MAEDRKIIIPKGVLEAGGNVVQIPSGLEDSLALIAKLQAKYGRPPRYYPPLTNPNNKFERRIGGDVVGLGLPALSPLREEPGRYQSSFDQYGSYYRSPETPQRRPRRVASPVRGTRPPPIHPSNIRRQLFNASGATDCSCSSDDLSGLLDSSGVSHSESPLARPLSSPPQMNIPRPGPSYPRPPPQHIRPPVRGPPPGAPITPLMRPPSPSPVRVTSPIVPPIRPSSPVRQSPPRTHMATQMRTPSPNLAWSYSNQRAPSPVVVAAHRAENRPPQIYNWEDSCSVDDISGLLSPESGSSRPPIRVPVRAESTPRRVQPRREISFSKADISAIMDESFTVSEELSNNALSESMRMLEEVERHESSRVQQTMRNFQSARRELVGSILTLHEVDTGGNQTRVNY